ncbi:hypothetical protein [Nitrosomonas sp.]|uniref:hypothetical protein n=1 Tax=Nitrosomonas sp. TaxID=42353 RepID=UPI001D3220D5|nr:hypothetical protein [Nitrosomonas sp.]MCB1948412.1 hypothetical protein [Nitrosomonas sp.]
MKILYILLLFFTVNTANVNAAIIDFSDGSWTRYSDLDVSFIMYDDYLSVSHYRPANIANTSYFYASSIANESGIVAFDWEVRSYALPQSTGVNYDASFLGTVLFSGNLNPNEIFSGHAEVIVSAGDTLSFSDGASGLSPYAIEFKLFNVREIPEPSVFALIFMGFMSLLVLKYRMINFASCSRRC